MINEQTLQGHWNEIKGSLKQRWGELTNHDLASFDGNVDRLVGAIQRKTGESRAAIRDFLEELTADGSSAIATVTESARRYAHRVTEAMQETYGQAAGRVRSAYAGAEETVRKRPAQSLAVAFGAGVIAGLILRLVFRSR